MAFSVPLKHHYEGVCPWNRESPWLYPGVALVSTPIIILLPWKYGSLKIIRKCKFGRCVSFLLMGHIYLRNVSKYRLPGVQLAKQNTVLLKIDFLECHWLNLFSSTLMLSVETMPTVFVPCDLTTVLECFCVVRGWHGFTLKVDIQSCCSHRKGTLLW